MQHTWMVLAVLLSITAKSHHLVLRKRFSPCELSARHLAACCISRQHVHPKQHPAMCCALQRTASVAINSAIKKNGLGVSLPSQACSAPSSYPITLSQLRLAAVTATGKDVTSELQRNKVQLLWTCFSDTTQSTKLGVFEETA
jgi:hypothetical protein